MRPYNRGMLILLSNDDGIFAPGLAAMYRVLKEMGEVHVVAPASGQSAAAHSITIDFPLICQRVHVGGEFWGESVEGQPADCVKLAVRALLPSRPDLVVSGINHGENVGIHVLYSGTVAAAAEGALLGIPAIAVSQECGTEMDYNRSARLAGTVIRSILDQKPRAGELFNVNIPNLRPDWPKGVRVARQSTVPIEDQCERRVAPGGRHYFWLQGKFGEMGQDRDTDLHAVREGYISVTPLHADLTDVSRLAAMQAWCWPTEPAAKAGP